MDSAKVLFMTLNVNDNVYNLKKGREKGEHLQKERRERRVSDSITLDMRPLLAQLRHFNYTNTSGCTLTPEAKQITFHQAADQHSPSEHQQQQSASPLCFCTCSHVWFVEVCYSQRQRSRGQTVHFIYKYLNIYIIIS